MHDWWCWEGGEDSTAESGCLQCMAMLCQLRNHEFRKTSRGCSETHRKDVARMRIHHSMPQGQITLCVRRKFLCFTNGTPKIFLCWAA